MNIEQLQTDLAKLETMLAVSLAQLNVIAKSVCDSCCGDRSISTGATQAGEVKDVVKDSVKDVAKASLDVVSQAQKILGAENVNDDKTKKLYKWAKDRGLSDDKWKGACFSVGVKKTTGMSDQQYDALRREIMAAVGVSGK